VPRRSSSGWRPIVVEEVDEVDAIFDQAIDRAIRSLPPDFEARLKNVAIVVEDEPSPAQLASTGAHGLFGLYQGVPLTSPYADAAQVANKITLFRGPLVRYSRSPSDLAQRVEHTLIHEIAHHFGITDARLRELQRY
jgi:predicted Zn-dependent protease with MMP-like domain